LRPSCACSGGHDVRVAFHPREALKLFHEFEPDTALLDIGLPEMDGYVLARKLCEVLRRRPLLVAITGYGNLDRRSQAEGFDYHFLKPVDPCDLDLAVRAAVNHHHPAGSAWTVLASSS
jgi:CheY-like chemotaxis protein